MSEIEINAMDLRFEHCRLRLRSQEFRLMKSILSEGVRTPCIGLRLANGICLLLDGFKRYRAAKILDISTLPFESIGTQETCGVIDFLNRCTAMNLNILEQAAFISYLVTAHDLNIGEIANRLDRSKSWVSMRRRLFDEMSPFIRAKLFDDQFPAYSYMYTLKSFMRMNETDSESVEKFVGSLSGKKLSTREIERLAYGYFKGPDEFKEAIDKGDVGWALRRSEGLFRTNLASCSGIEHSTLKDIELHYHTMKRLRGSLNDHRLKTSSFFCQANLLVGHILAESKEFLDFLRRFYDRSRTP
jgi:hypothetical protein